MALYAAVTFIVNFNTHEEKVSLDVLCYQSMYNADFQVTVEISPEMKQAIICNENSTKNMKVFDGLSCKANYNVSIYWKTPNMSLNTHCLLKYLEFFPQCKGNNNNIN